MSEAVQALPPAMLLPALLIVTSLLGTATLIIGYFLKDWKAAQKEKDAAQDQAIEGVRKDIADFKAALPHHYVLRDDFIRAVAGLDLKMDRMAREVSEINKSLARLLGGISDVHQ
ncbi:MAG: hypothetical protein AB1523_00200 [Bacillota bacterium]